MVERESYLAQEIEAVLQVILIFNQVNFPSHGPSLFVTSIVCRKRGKLFPDSD
jgi:hypothetical protein